MLCVMFVQHLWEKRRLNASKPTFFVERKVRWDTLPVRHKELPRVGGTGVVLSNLREEGLGGQLGIREPSRGAFAS